MSRVPDVGAQLSAALIKQASAAGCSVRVDGARQTAWSSATFAGARHELALIADRCDTFDRWLTNLPEAEFALRGHLVADIAVTERSNHDDAVIRIEALTVEES